MDLSQTKYSKNLFNSKENIIILKSTNNDGIVSHSHEFIELVYVSSGKGIHSINGNSYVVSAGDLFIICTNDHHSLLPIDGVNTSFNWINCIFLPEFINYNFTPFSPEFRYISTECFEMNYIFNSMLSEFLQKTPAYLDVLRCYLFIVLTKLSRLMHIKDKQPNYTKLKKQSNLKKAIEYIHLNYLENIDLKSLCLYLDSSQSYVYKIFIEFENLSPISYINKYRIDQSCKLLTESSFPIYRVAQESGFKDTKFYYSLFKRSMGITPGHFRSKHQG